MSWLDVMLLALLGLSLFGGYRRGAVRQVIGLAGLAFGVVIGVLVAPRLARLGRDPLAHVGLALGAVLLGGAAGNLLGWVIGTRIRDRTQGSRLERADAIGGSVVSVVALLLSTWFIALNLANGPFPQLARGIRESRIVRTIDAVMPAPPSIVGGLQRALSQLGFPDVFVGLPPAPGEPVPPPSDEDAARAFRAAKDGTVEVLGRGCYTGFLNQGSGFVVAPGYVVTNAHVVAGTREHWVHLADDDHPASVVAFDPQLDLAVLRTPSLDLKPLRLMVGEVNRGAAGAVLGFPGGGPLEGIAAAVRQVIEPEGRDIYGDGTVTRRLYELQAEIHRGNSGGPFVLPDGRVAGVVFANSVVADGVGYAIVSEQVRPLVREGRGRAEPVGTGSCTN